MPDFDPRHLDKRVSARYVQRGALSEKDYEKHLKQLPDLAEKAERVNLEQPTSDNAPTR